MKKDQVSGDAFILIFTSLFVYLLSTFFGFNALQQPASLVLGAGLGLIKNNPNKEEVTKDNDRYQAK